jgi:uncharacterized protein (TIGR04255 family)
VGGTHITHAVSPRLYVAAPITEAVAEVRFAGGADLRVLQKLSRKVADFYPNEVQQKARGVSVDFVAEAASFTDEEDIIRRSSTDEANILVLRNNAVSVSRLAPYTQWNDFRARIERDLGLALKSRPKSAVTRVGLRYINRLDIPLRGTVGPYEEYLNLHVRIPELIDGVGSFGLVFQTVHNDFGIRVQSGLTDAPVPDTAAVVLDIDVYKLEQMRSDLPEIMGLLDALRVEKNLLFEAFITDSARALFDR